MSVDLRVTRLASGRWCLTMSNQIIVGLSHLGNEGNERAPVTFRTRSDLVNRLYDLNLRIERGVVTLNPDGAP